MKELKVGDVYKTIYPTEEEYVYYEKVYSIENDRVETLVIYTNSIHDRINTFIYKDCDDFFNENKNCCEKIHDDNLIKALFDPIE